MLILSGTVLFKIVKYSVAVTLDIMLWLHTGGISCRDVSTLLWRYQGASRWHMSLNILAASCILNICTLLCIILEASPCIHRGSYWINNPFRRHFSCFFFDSTRLDRLCLCLKSQNNKGNSFSLAGSCTVSYDMKSFVCSVPQVQNNITEAVLCWIMTTDGNYLI